MPREAQVAAPLASIPQILKESGYALSIPNSLYLSYLG